MEAKSSKGGGDQSDRAGEQSPRLEADDYLGTMNLIPGRRPELPTVAKSVDITSGVGLLQNKLSSVVENPYATGHASTRVMVENGS